MQIIRLLLKYQILEHFNNILNNCAIINIEIKHKCSIKFFVYNFVLLMWTAFIYLLYFFTPLLIKCKSLSILVEENYVPPFSQDGVLNRLHALSICRGADFEYCEWDYVTTKISSYNKIPSISDLTVELFVQPSK